eukprot:NODE_673_length_1276_cov_164.026110_g634_i0.p1 GENE.NODE_673_length_1276_cov_164.026110_g634_i0~~NODE_673_length_1276_cov_164.026110_g634_i0.p1  ORF type:complete len:372 (+),score=105.52 NODE_673_length_1276_cov_164.026110_g634_i0:64-1179(+)
MAEQKYDNGDTYNGASQAGKRHGQGTYKTADGSTSWEGTWKDDLLNGHGTYSGADGKYTGDFESSEKSGKGEFVWTTGDKYVGDWFKDTMNGEGQYYWPDGKTYNGCFRDGARNGVGVLVTPDGSKYEGEFKNDKCEGYGRFKDPNGGSYEGEWKENMKHGHGVYSYPDGRKYDGEFVNDKKTTGFIINPDGSRIKVTFNPDGSILSQEAVQDKAPEPPAPPPPPPANTNYKGVGDAQTDQDKQNRQAGVQNWLAMDDKQRALNKAQAMCLSFGGEPDVMIRGGRTGNMYFRDKFKKQDQEFKPTGSAPDVIPYEELRLPSKWNRPDIDPLSRENYLSDAEFQNIFKMTRDEFKLVPTWKRNQLKQIVKLY